MTEQDILNKRLPEVFDKILTLGRDSIDIEHWTASEVICKLFEEGGELSTATMIETGKMPHKKLDNPDEVFEEVADVIICALDAATKVYHEKLSGDEIKAKVIAALERKSDKWRNKVLIPQSDKVANL